MIAEVTIDQTMHQTIAQPVESLGGGWLRDAVASRGAQLIIGGHRQGGRAAKRRVDGRRPIDVESP